MKRRQLRTVALVLPLVTGALVLPSAAGATGTPAGQPPLTAAEAKALSTNVSDKVIVVLKNQLPTMSDSPRDEANRAAAIGHVQAGVVDELARTGARQVKRFQLINAVTATVSPGEARRLSANPSVAEVVPDEPIPLTSSVPNPARTPHSGIAPLAGACPRPGQVQLDPQAIEAIHAASQSGAGATAQALGYTGAGVKVAFIADGLDINNPDFIRANGKKVFVDYQDFSGTGTKAPTNGAEAFLDASSIAAQGLHTYDIAGYGRRLPGPLPHPHPGGGPGGQPGRTERLRLVQRGLQLGLPGSHQLRRDRRPRGTCSTSPSAPTPSPTRPASTSPRWPTTPRWPPG